VRITILCLVSSLSLVACRSSDNPVRPDFAMKSDMHVVSTDLAGDMNGKDLTLDSGGDGGVDAGPPDMTPPPDLYEPPFAAPKEYAASAGAQAIAAGTISPHTHTDLVTVGVDPSSGASSLDVLAGAGNGTFGTKSSIVLTGSAEMVALVDVSGDGNIDAVVTYNGTGVQVLLGDGNGSFGAPTVYEVTNAIFITAARIGDIDGDGFLDIVVADNGNFPATANSPVYVLLNDQNGGFPAAKQAAVSVTTTNDSTAWRSPIELRLGQVDNDAGGKLDIAVVNTVNTGGTVSVLTNASTPGNVSFSVGAEAATGLGPTDVAIVPIDGQTHPGLVVTNGADNNFGIYPPAATMAGTVAYGTATTYDAHGNAGGSPQPVSATSVDLDHDGFADVLVASEEAGGFLTIVYGGANGVFNLMSNGRMGTEFVPACSGPTWLTTGQFDTGTSIDVAVSCNGGNSAAVLLNKR
jgi:hypothetical protein